MNSYNEQHEMMIKKFWISVWLSTADRNSKETATDWADYAVVEFDKRFKKIEEDNESK